MKYIKFVKKNIRRTPYQALAALSCLFLTFLVLSVFLIIAGGSEQILRYYEGKPQAIAFFKDGTTDNDVEAIKNALNKLNTITKFKYVSKEEALQIYRERNKNNPMLLELVTANILPASLEISTRYPEDLKEVAAVVKKEPVVEEVVFPEDVVSSLSTAAKMIRIIGGGAASFLIVFSTLIIIMIIGFKIRIKRQEIETMKLMGASNWFIRTPYLLEGIFYALVGALGGWAVGFGLIWYFQPLLQGSLGEVSSILFPLPLLFAGELLLAELAVAFLVGGLGALTAVRRYLHL